MKALIDSNFLQRINQGAYRVNPEVIFKGSMNGRLNVLYQYHDTNRENQQSAAASKEIEPND